MWFIQTKKEIKKIVDNIKESLTSLTSQGVNNKIAVVKNKDKIRSNSHNYNNLKSQVDSNKVKIARLEGAISVLLSKSQKSQSQAVSSSLRDKIETKVINKIRRSKKSLVMAEINRLEGSMSPIEVYESIVKERGLCSKASFYRYLASLTKSQKEKVRLN